MDAATLYMLLICPDRLSSILAGHFGKLGLISHLATVPRQRGKLIATLTGRIGAEVGQV
jgi:hypothetical protein